MRHSDDVSVKQQTARSALMAGYPARAFTLATEIVEEEGAAERERAAKLRDDARKQFTQLLEPPDSED